jgi:hypothetical protein
MPMLMRERAPAPHEVVDFADGKDAALARPSTSSFALRSMCGPRNRTSRAYTSTPVKMLAMTPTMSVTAKPLIGPVPNCASTMPEMIVVTWPSRMALKALA